MTSFDFAPLFRTAIGFDRLARLVDTASTTEASGYPPYNIEKLGDENYRLTMAVAGFRPEELDLVVKDNTLVISGRPAAEAQKHEVLYRGIAGRAFERGQGLVVGQHEHRGARRQHDFAGDRAGAADDNHVGQP